MIRTSSKRIQRFSLPLACLLIFILIPHGSTSNLVICFTEEGEVILETSHSGCCCPVLASSLAEPSPLLSPSKKLFSKNHLPFCRDIPISTASFNQNIIFLQSPLKSIPTLHLTYPPFQKYEYIHNAPHKFFVYGIPPSNYIYASLESTFLLI